MRFDDIIKQPGSDRVVMAMGANFRDLNNDGLREIYSGRALSPTPPWFPISIALLKCTSWQGKS